MTSHSKRPPAMIETLTAKGDPIPQAKQRSISISLGVMLGADIEDEFRDLL
jgi:hypothetical protein